MKIIPLVAALLLGGLAASASAGVRPPVVFDFSNLKANGGNGSFLPSETLNTDYWKCTGGDLCSSDIDHSKILGGDLKYTVSGITATATGYYKGAQVSVMQDHEDGYNAAKSIGAGLGVYHKIGDTADDNVTFGETLKLTFSKAVTLSAVSLRSDGHDTTHFDKNATFLLNGVKLALAGNLNFSLQQFTGTEFTFAFDSSKRIGSSLYNGDQFYLGGVTVSAVPEPETWAMMVGGLGLLGFAARRRRSDVRLG